MLHRNKVKKKGELTLYYENEKFTVKNGSNILLNECHADSCICLLIGLSSIIPKDLIRQVLKISAEEEKKLPVYDEKIKSEDVTLKENDIVTEIDDLNIITVKYQGKTLFVGSYNDSIQVISSVGILIGNKTAYKIMIDPRSVSQIVFGL